MRERVLSVGWDKYGQNRMWYNTKVATGLYPTTFIDALYYKSVLSCLDFWKTSFNHPTAQEYYFLTLRGKNCKLL